MPKPVSPDRPIWSPLPAETDRRPAPISDAPEPAAADAGASEPADSLAGPGTLPDPAGPAASAVMV